MKLRCDSHSDLLHTFLRLNIQDYDLNKNRPNLKTDIPKLKTGGVNAIFLALFTKEMWGVEGGAARIELGFRVLDKLLEYNEDLYLGLSPASILHYINRGKIAVNLAVENGTCIGKDLGLLTEYFNRGVRYLTLCHNKSNLICDSSTDEPIHGGLSEFGKKVIKTMNNLGMMIDISHASDQSVEDILNISELPIIASHSNSRAICNNPRNLNDELLERIARKDGVVQLTVLPKCVSDLQNPNILEFMEHTNYVVKLIGIDHVGIGTDFDGGGGVDGFNHIGEAKNLTKELEDSGYSEGEIDKIWGLNFLRVYSENFSSKETKSKISLDKPKENGIVDLV